MTLDLDNFKAINDSCGHLAGDKALVLVASAILGCARKSDVAGRLGGDEFALILPGIGDGGRAGRRGGCWPRSRPQAGVGASLGIAVSEPGETDPLLVMARADVSLLEAKRAGKRTYRLSA